MKAAAAGASRELWRSGEIIEGGETKLHAKGEVSALQTRLAGNARQGGLLDPLTMDMQGLRFGLEIGHDRGLSERRRLEVSLDAGGRADFGDGTGEEGRFVALEIGPGLRYLDPESGLSLEGRGHLLTAEGSRKEWGADIVLGYDPGAIGEGLSFDLSSGYGASPAGAGQLWNQETAAFLPGGASAPTARLDAELGYGFPILEGRGLFAPYGGYRLSGTQSRSTRIGGRWQIGAGMNLAIEGEQRRNSSGEESLLSLTGQGKF